MPDSVEQIFSVVGGDIETGSRLTGCSASNNPCRQAYGDWCGPNNGRSSWDPIVVMAAVRGPGGIYCNLQTGQKVSIDDNGAEYWSGGGDMSRMWYQNNGVKGMIESTIDQLLCTPPKHVDPQPTSDGWFEAIGFNCYGSRNGDSGHGATDLENPVWASCGDMSLAECKTRCDDMNGCTGITTLPSSEGKMSFLVSVITALHSAHMSSRRGPKQEVSIATAPGVTNLATGTARRIWRILRAPHVGS